MSRHTHKYRRMNLGRNGDFWVMQCALPQCSHYTPMETKISAPALVGKTSLCNKCGDPFELSRDSLRKSHPVCDDCIVSPAKKRIAKAAKFLESMGSAIELDKDI